MNHKFSSLLAMTTGTMIGMTIANFVWAIVFSHDYGQATERSYFQIAAVWMSCYTLSGWKES